MQPPSLILDLFPGAYSVCRLGAAEPVPAWALAPGGFASITRSREELSIVCADGLVPPATKVEKGMRILKVQGPLDFAITGILASLAVPLAQAEVSLFAVSTYDTDYVLVPGAKLAIAVAVLRGAGHEVRTK